MCELCDNTPENEPPPSCQDCGRLICFDIEADDDICARAYVTASGDLYCRRCGRRYDEFIWGLVGNLSPNVKELLK